MAQHPRDVLRNLRKRLQPLPASQLAGVTSVAVYVDVDGVHTGESAVIPEVIENTGALAHTAEKSIRAVGTGSQSMTTPKSLCVGHPVVGFTVQFSSHGASADPKCREYLKRSSNAGSPDMPLSEVATGNPIAGKANVNVNPTTHPPHSTDDFNIPPWSPHINWACVEDDWTWTPSDVPCCLQCRHVLPK
jgi:hypothetical protein